MINKNIKKTILITGGTGYIGSCLAAYLSEIYNVFTIDKKKKNKFLGKKIIHYKINLNDRIKLEKFIKKIKPHSIIHLSGQSTIDAVDKKKNSYIKNNFTSTRILIKILKKLNITNFVFSSTAAVYDKRNQIFRENSKLNSNNIYGTSKIKCEKEIIDQLKNTNIRYCILRFFNVSGSFKKYKIGEFHSPETHLIPIIINSIINNKTIKIYGDNYKTSDGTCLRDYVHIKDIISAIKKAIEFNEKKNFESEIFNLGSGKCYSILEILKTCKNFSKKNIKTKFVRKRKYDVPFLRCNIKKSNKLLNWKPIHSNIKKIILDEVWWNKYLKKKKIKREFIY